MPLNAPPNPAWPLLRVLWSPTSNGTYDMDAVHYTDITRRCLKQWSVSRGRQYEYDTVQPGTFTATCKNLDGALNPMSGASPFAPYVTPFRRLTVEAQWPPTPNLLTADQATAGQATPYAPGAIPAVMDVTTDVSGAVLSLAASASAFQGSQVYQAAVPGGASTGFSVINIRHLPVECPGLGLPPVYYSWSEYIRSATGGVNPQMAAQIKWFDASGATVGSSLGSTVSLTGGSSAPWVRVAVSAQPPDGAAWGYGQLVLRGTTPAGAWTFQAAAAQFEQGGAPTGWAEPGTWYPIFTGGVERYPQTSDLTGTRALTPITASDVLALLPQSKLTASLNGIIATPNGVGGGGADFVYTLGDPAGSTTFSDLTGQRAAATVQQSKAGSGTIRSGSAITSTDPGWGFIGAGTDATVTHFTVGGGYAPGLNTPGPCAMIDLGRDAAGNVGPPATGGFTRMIAFSPTTALTSSSNAPATLWRAFGTVVNGGTLLECSMSVAYDSATGWNEPEWTLTDGANFMSVHLGFPLVQGDWYVSFIGVSDDRRTGFRQFGSGSYGTTAFATPLTWPAGFFQDSLGATTIQSNSSGLYAYAGFLAYAVQWPFALTSDQMTEIYNTWRTAYQGDSSGVRAGRILNWAGYTGARALDPGVSTSLGAATDVDGLDALTALQNVQNTEGGEFFAARDGTATLYSRARLFTVPVPSAVFGADAGAGEVPYVSCDLDFDPALIENDVEIAQVSTGQIAYGIDAASEVSTGTRTFSRANQSSVFQEVQDQADYLATDLGHAKVRVAQMVLRPSTQPQLLWPVCLALELGAYVQVNWRPIGSDVGAVDPTVITGFVEKIDITGGPGADAYWTLQISSAPGTGGGPSVPAARPWNLALLHTTLHAQADAGATSVVIDALPTAPFSTLAQNLPGGGPGWQLVLGDGLPTAETRIIESVSATAPGWSTATVTFTTPLANAHDAGETVREPLGLAFQDTWRELDGYSALDTMQITY